jgi:predicted nucleotidyltransferase
MITAQEKKVLMELKQRLLSLSDIVELKLFGSRARENYDPQSDYDILIVVPELSSELKDNIREVIWEVGFANDMFISSLIVSKHEWYESPLRVSPIKSAIEEEGESGDSH